MSVPTGCRVNRSRIAFTMEVTGWCSANARTGPGMVVGGHEGRGSAGSSLSSGQGEEDVLQGRLLLDVLHLGWWQELFELVEGAVHDDPALVEDRDLTRLSRPLRISSTAANCPVRLMDSRTSAGPASRRRSRWPGAVPVSALSSVDRIFTTGGLACPVGAEQGEDAARRHLEVNAAQHWQLLV